MGNSQQIQEVSSRLTATLNNVNNITNNVRNDISNSFSAINNISNDFRPNNYFTAEVNPVINFNPDLIDEVLAFDQRIVIKVLFAAGMSAAAAYALDESPLFFMSIGGLTSALNIRYIQDDLTTVGIGTALSAIRGHNIIKSTLITGFSSFSNHLIR